MFANRKIDVLEDYLRQKGKLLDILLLDRTTKKNIIWATDSYEKKYGKIYAPKKQILPDLVTGEYGLLIQPRAAKNREEQRRRTKDKAEVFTPLKIIKQMNDLVDSAKKKLLTASTWQDYVKEPVLEITCGEAPFIVSRYNPTAVTGRLIKIENRVGFLDRKLRVVSEYCDTPRQWLHWAREAFKASYGYEWQGDNILLARENLLYSLKDYYFDKFGKKISLKTLESFAEIISWNIFQMDGLRCVVPMSCRHETKVIIGDLTLFGKEPNIVERNECEGCKYSRPKKHNGRYVKVMDWEKGKAIRFVDIQQ